MSEQELIPLKKPSTELSQLFAGISAIKAVEPDPRALFAEEDLNRDYPEVLGSVREERDAAEIKHLQEGVRHTRRVNTARFVVLTSLFLLIILWLVSVIVLTALCGLHAWGFSLSDKVIITYITSTTVSVLGLFHIAARWLFSAKHAPSQSASQDNQSSKADESRQRP